MMRIDDMKRGIPFLLLLVCLGLNAQTNCLIKGKVTCEGKGLKGVVVTDGLRCVQTNDQGEYEIPSLRDSRFVYVSTPAGYLPLRDYTIPLFYHQIMPDKDTYDFELQRNRKDDYNHVFIAQADVQMVSKKDLNSYKIFLKDCEALVKTYQSSKDIFGVDCGDIVGDTPSLFPDYIEAIASLDIPVYRAIGNHDMDYWGRTHETSYKTFEKYFGPTCYSFNRGQAHYIVIDNNFFIGRDYFYMGYIDEKTFSWLEQDLSFVKEGSPVFIITHIPLRLQEEQRSFDYAYSPIADQTVNSAALFAMLRPYKTNIISGHMHYNFNLVYSPGLMEHNTAAVCGTWWCGDICMDGAPQGYGVYKVDGDKVTWYYKGANFPKEYQFKAYLPGASEEYPDNIIVNVWNWDKGWRVEWVEDNKEMGEMTHFTGYDPDARDLCNDKTKVTYDWISPITTDHLFRAVPGKTNSKIEIVVTDRFGNKYNQKLR